MPTFMAPVDERPSFPWGRYPSSGGYHPAYDYGVPLGTPVVAPASGKVIIVEYWDYSYGHHVWIEHADKHVSILAHMGVIPVREGQSISAGTLVGYSNTTGNSTGPHLHWETRTSRYGYQRHTAYDPGPYITGVPDDTYIPPDPGAPPYDPGTGTPVYFVQGPGQLLVPAATAVGTPGLVDARFTPPRRAA